MARLYEILVGVLSLPKTFALKDHFARRPYFVKGALSTDPSFREAWRKEMLAARTLAGVATLVYSLLASAAGVLPALQEQDKQEQALVNQVGGRRPEREMKIEIGRTRRDSL